MELSALNIFYRGSVGRKYGVYVCGFVKSGFFLPTQPGPSDFSCGLVGSYIQLSLEKGTDPIVMPAGDKSVDSISTDTLAVVRTSRPLLQQKRQ